MIVDQIKQNLVQYVEDITDHSKKGNRDAYICPLCSSGTGKNKTGAFTIQKDGLRWKCFACDRSGDVLDLIGYVEEIPDFSNQLKRAGELFKIPIENPSLNNFLHTDFKMLKEGNEMTETIKKDYLQFFEEAHANIKKTNYPQKRGLSDKILNKFKIGYIEDWKHPNAADNVSTSPRLIIPVTKYSYFARDTREDIPDK